MAKKISLTGLVILALSAGCSQNHDRADTPGRYDAIGQDEVINLVGNEPFWGIEIDGGQMTYSTPENIEGAIVPVARFSGNNGLGFTADLDSETVQIAVTPGVCSDGMSDREYPLTATVQIGDKTLFGCGYSTSNPYTGGDGE